MAPAIAPDRLLDGRLTTIAGDSFDHVPAGANPHLLVLVLVLVSVRVLLDWPDDDCLHLSRNCRAAMHDGVQRAALTPVASA